MFESLQPEEIGALKAHLDMSYNEMQRAMKLARKILKTETRKWVRTAQKRILATIPDLLTDLIDMQEQLRRET